MKRITIFIDEEQKEFIEEKSNEFGNRSKVIRAAIDQLQRKQEIEKIQKHFKTESKDKEDTAKFGEKSWEDLPDY